MVKIKDENAPKRPPSAYFIWINDQRAAVMAKNPKAGVTEMAKIFGDMWKLVPVSTKKLYEARNEKLKKEYERDMAKYKKTASYAEHFERLTEAKIKETRKAFRQDENAPKRPLSAYFQWMMAVGRPAHLKKFPAAAVKHVAKACGEQWSSLPETQKKPYLDKFEKELKKWKTQMDKYKKTAKWRKYDAEKQEWKEKQSRKRKRLEAKLEKPNKGEKKPKKKAKKAKTTGKKKKTKGKAKKVTKPKAKKATRPKKRAKKTNSKK